MQAGSLGRELPNSPSDGISAVTFSSQSDNFLVSSWDTKVRLYDATSSALRGVYSHTRPVLDCCFLDDHTGVSAGADNTVKRFDFSGGWGTGDVIGTHDKPVKCIEFSPTTGQLISGGWDRQLRVWDARGSPGGSPLSSSLLPERVYSMSLQGHRLVVAMAGRHVWIFDVRHMPHPEQRRESSLKYQTKCVRMYPDASGYALSSVEGRVAMEYCDVSEAGQANKYAFKCHRKAEDGRDTVYPVSTLSFHPLYGTFATGGCDGLVNLWDGSNKKRLYQYNKYPTSIAALAFNRDGSLLAVASSYTYELGEMEHPRDCIYIRQVNDGEVKPKPKSYAAA